MLLRRREKLGIYPERLTDCLIEWARKTPDTVFLAKRNKNGGWRKITYRQALDIARRVGQWLLGRGLSANRPILILSENDIEHALLALAAQFAGIPYAPVSTANSLVSQDFEKLSYIVRTLTPGLVFAADGRRYGRAIQAAINADVEVVVSENELEDRDCTLFDTLLNTEPTSEIDAAQAATNLDSIAKFLFTSGSTKLPKAVVNTQRMLCANQQMLRQCLPLLAEAPPVLVDWLPWAHTMGGNNNVGLALYNGGTLYIDDGKPTPQGMAETIRNLKEIAPTVYFNVPKGYEALVAELRDDPALRKMFFSQLRMFFYAGAGLSQPVWDALQEVAQKEIGKSIPILTGLGMTETAPNALFPNRLTDRSGMIGVPCHGITLKLVPDGDKLEARYAGPSVTPGYWRAPQETADAFDQDGYFKSGDAVRFVDAAMPELGLMFDGRIAEDFKLATGTWVSVGPLRTQVILKGAPYVQDAVVIGHDRDDIGLLILPNYEECRQLATNLSSNATSSEIANAPQVRSWFQQLVNRLWAEGTGSSSRVARAHLLPHAPSFERGEITEKGSLNQRAMLRSYDFLVEEMYCEVPPVRVICAERAEVLSKV